jgi:acyl carrier protein
MYIKNVDPDDLSDLLSKIETSFNIKFVGDELLHITTFGQLCKYITNKIELDTSYDCTSQQAFYKLRQTISTLLKINHNTILTNTLLSDLFPKSIRREMISNLENELGIKLNLLKPSAWITNILFLMLLTSIAAFIFKMQYSLTCIIFSLIGFWLANKTGSELKLKTVEQMAKEMTRTNYLKSRRNPLTFHKMEVEEILKGFFVIELGLDRNQITKETKVFS